MSGTAQLLDGFRELFTPNAPIAGTYNPAAPEQRTWLQKLIGDKTIDRFSADAISQLVTDYQSNIGLGNFTFSADAFDTHKKQRVSDLAGLQKTVKPESESSELYKQLTDTSTDGKKKAAKDIKTSLNSALVVAPDSKYEKARADFRELIATLPEMLKQVPKKYKVDGVRGALAEITDDARKAIEEQQKEELVQFQAQVNSNEFRTHLETMLDTDDDKTIDNAKASLIKDLENAHKKQLEDFNKEVADALTKLDKAKEAELKALLFIANLHKFDPDMRAIIEGIAARNREKFNGGITEVTENADGTDISCVNLDQLKTIKRLGGEEIQVKEKDGKTVLSIEMGMRATNPRYYFSGQAEKDMRMMAQRIYAGGATGIKMNINFDNKEVAQQRAEEAYKACMMSGFKEDQIRIVVNGQLYTQKAEKDKSKSFDELFKDSPGTLSKIRSKALKHQQEVEKVISEGMQSSKKGPDIREAREAMTKLREDKKAQEAAKAAQAASTATPSAPAVDHSSTPANN